MDASETPSSALLRGYSAHGAVDLSSIFHLELDTNLDEQGISRTTTVT
jgi:hypothetical protein